MKRRALNICLNLASKFCNVSSAKENVANINIYSNPCIKLSQYLEVPLLEEYEQFFSPGIESLYAAQDLFIPKPGHIIRPLKFAIDPDKFPEHDLPEVVFIGKSNAGKSSLLKAIFKDYPNIRIDVSKNPGHTKCAKFYEVGSKLCIVDMPGYGFGQPEWFEECVGGYLKNRKNLVRAFFLIDGKTGFQSLDEDALNMLEDSGTPYALIMTKIDMTSDGRLLRNLIHLKKIKDRYSSLCCFPQPFLVSSTSYEGLAHLLAFIGHITGNLSVYCK